MISIEHSDKKVELSYETGEDYKFLNELLTLIHLRNHDKKQITNLKKELIQRGG